jgi:hypothetical protein
MNFRNLVTAKTLRFVAVTVVLGAVGSGAWEWLLKPILVGASEFGLNVATLGIRSFKDSLYRDIARGLHEEPSMRLYAAVFVFLPAFILGLIAGGFSAHKVLRGGANATLATRIVEKLTRPVLIFFVFLLVFSVVQANQLAYVNRAVAHFRQVLAIAGPHITDAARLTHQSEFAQISSSEDYGKLISTLEEVCRAKGLKVPAFSVW